MTENVAQLNGIKSVTLINIKSHLNTHIDFSSGFNVISGETNEGKSTIYWGLNWCLFNEVPRSWKPKPWKGLKANKEPSSFAVEFMDGQVLTRVQKGSDNYYIMPNGQKLRGLHGKVPEQVTALVRMNENNIQPQSESFFLLNKTSGHVAREINKLSDLSKMGATLKESDRRVKDTKKEIKQQEVFILEKQTAIESSLLPSDLLLDLEYLENLESRIKKEQEKLDFVSNLIGTAGQLEEELKMYPDDSVLEKLQALHEKQVEITATQRGIQETEKLVSTVLSLKEDIKPLYLIDSALVHIENMKFSLTHLNESTEKLNKIVNTIKTITDIKQQLTQLPSSELLLVLSGFKQRYESVKEMEANLNSTISIVSNIVTINDKILNLEIDIADEEHEIESIRESIEECPLCLTVFPKK